MVDKDDEMLIEMNSPADQNLKDNMSEKSSDSNENLINAFQKDLQYNETEPNPAGFFAETDDQSCTVKVAVRVRPHVGRELKDRDRGSCIDTQSILNKLTIGTKMFQFDKVYDQDSQQDEIFDVCTKNLILGCFHGYNATILAYGQTGSGKTHTMGTGSTVGLSSEQIGIVPRVFDFIFQELENRRKQSEYSEFSVKVQFLELYGEELHDLLDMGVIDRATGKSSKQLSIREEKNGSIKIENLKGEHVNSKAECIQLLNKGISHRVTAATQMNEESSRSHAIFTVTIDQKIVKVIEPLESDEALPTQDGAQPDTSEENISAKFHFVDLAGSERIKKTGAAGKQLAEGISINRGLLALGNVISALTDEKKVRMGAGTAHIPYRDSKLTRILQDSLGGNSRTTMIACVSPAESNYEESMGTIKYASRARNIKNKPIVNRDPNSLLIEGLRNQVTSLQTEIGEYQDLLKNNNISIPDEFNSIVKTKSAEQHEKFARRTSILGASLPGLPKMMTSRDSFSSSGGMGLPSARGGDHNELRELKLRLARKENELREVTRTLNDYKQGKVTSKQDSDELQKERDELIMQNEQLQKLLDDNNIKSNSVMHQAPTIGGKRTQTLIDEYKAKIHKFQTESEKKTAEILTKSKKIAELQSHMKRDETVLKKAVEENSKMKKEIHNAKKQPASPRGFGSGSNRISGAVSPRFSSSNSGSHLAPTIKSPRSRRVANKEEAKKDLLSVDDLNAKLMEKLTSEFEDVFQVDDEPLLLIDDHPAQTSDEEHEENENHVKEASAATTLEEKKKFLDGLKQKSDHIKEVMGEFLKNTWAQRIQQIEHEKAMAHVEHKKKVVAASTSKDDAATKALEKEYKAKMDGLNKQIAEQQRAKQKKEDQIKKTMVQQEARIKVMESELSKIKKQKEEVELQKKYGDERYSKMRVQTGKDITTFKKTVQDKEKNVINLKVELKKTDAIVSQKMNELKALQKKAFEDKQKRIKEEEKDQESKGVDIDAIKDWIHQSTDQLLRQQELGEYLKKLHSQKEEIEDEMLTEGDRLTELIMNKERHESELNAINVCIEEGIEFDEAKRLELERDLEDVMLESDSITQTLDDIDGHLDYVNSQIASLQTQIKAFDMDAIQPPRFKGLNNVDMARQTLRTFFMVLLDLNVYKKELENKCIQQDEQVMLLQSQVAVLKENSNMTDAQQKVAMRKQAKMRALVSQVGDGIDFDNRDADAMHLSQAEQQQLTKMSLSKIVSNLRASLKEQQTKNQSLSARLDTVTKEKDQFKLKFNQLQKEQKLRGGRGPGTETMPMNYSQPRGHGNVQSKINTNLKASTVTHSEEKKTEVFSGFATQNAPRIRQTQSQINNVGAQLGRKLSYKQRREQIKSNQTPGRLGATQSNVDSLSTKTPPKASSKPITNLNDARRNKPTMGKEDQDNLNAQVANLEKEANSLATGSSDAKKEARRKSYLGDKEAGGNFLTSPSQPETVQEVDDDAEDDKIIIVETDDILSEQRQPPTQSMLEGSFAKESLSSDEEITWNFEDITGLPVDDGQSVVDIDSIGHRLFIMFDDLTLTEVNMQTKEIVREIQMWTLEGAQEQIQGDDKATAFDMFKDLNMIAVSTAKGVHLFDYEDEMSHVTTLNVRNVSYLTFIDVYIVMLIESEDGADATLLCYQIDGEEPEGSITIKQFMGQKVKVRQGDQSVCYSTGSQIGRISVPDMELEYQEDAGHQIIDFATTDTTIFTTGTDESIKLFDSDTGMQLIEPMEDMECDSLAVQGYFLVARCGGGQAMFVYKYMDGDEDLNEEDFIETEKIFGKIQEGEDVKFWMKGGLNVTLDDIEYNMILTAHQTEQGLVLKMLRNKAPS